MANFLENLQVGAQHPMLLGDLSQAQPRGLSSGFNQGLGNLLQRPLQPQVSTPQGYPTTSISLEDILKFAPGLGTKESLQQGMESPSLGGKALGYGSAALDIIPGISAAKLGIFKAAPLLGGMIVGRKALTKESPEEIERLAQKGVEKYEKFGWFKDVVGDIQREVSDIGATITPDFRIHAEGAFNPDVNKLLMNSGNKKVDFSLGEVLKHDELYQLYPNAGIENLKVKINPDMKALGAWEPSVSKEGRLGAFATIHINPRRIQELAKKEGRELTNVLTSIILHETQHAIQTYENFSGGASPEYFKQLLEPNFLKTMNESLKEIENKKKLRPEDSGLIAQEQYYKNFLDFAENIKKGSYGEDKLYFNTLGEQQARDVSERFLRAKNPRWGEEAVYSTRPRTGGEGRILTPYTSLKANIMGNVSPRFRGLE
jgi:hypothetical protein